MGRTHAEDDSALRDQGGKGVHIGQPRPVGPVPGPESTPVRGPHDLQFVLAGGAPDRCPHFAGMEEANRLRHAGSLSVGTVLPRFAAISGADIDVR